MIHRGPSLAKSNRVTEAGAKAKLYDAHIGRAVRTLGSEEGIATEEDRQKRRDCVVAAARSISAALNSLAPNFLTLPFCLPAYKPHIVYRS